MSSIWQLILALPEILRLLVALIEHAKEVKKEHEVNLNLKDEVKILNEAIKTGDTTKLNKLRY
jgi:hypothetical protein